MAALLHDLLAEAVAVAGSSGRGLQGSTPCRTENWIRRRCAGLRAGWRGVEPGDRVAILMNKPVDCVSAIYGS